MRGFRTTFRFPFPQAQYAFFLLRTAAPSYIIQLGVAEKIRIQLFPWLEKLGRASLNA